MHGEVREPLVGLLIDQRYQVLARVAHGGMATVYRALDLRLDREVAVKVLHPHLSSDATFLDRLGREAKAAARLSHPRVVGVLDQGEERRDNQLLAYLVMEYLPGHTLRTVLSEQVRLTPRLALTYLDAIVEGLAAAHDSGLVHRDIKPENVLIADDGRIKLGDFGLARAVTTSTNTGTLIGTVAYVSPELVMGRPADARSDIYAVGIMLYEMLTGQQPFQGEVPIHVAYQHVNASVPVPSDKVPELAADLDELVRWCTERDPEDRPHDGAALLGEIRHIRTTLSDAELDAGGTSFLLPAVPSPAAPEEAAPGANHLQTDLPWSADPSHIEEKATEALRRDEFPTEAITAAGDPQHTEILPGQSAPSALQPTATLLRPGKASASTGFDDQARLLTPRQAKATQRRAAKQAARSAATPVTELRRGNSRRRGILILIFVLLLALLGASAGWFFGSGPGALARVPELRDQSVDQASSALEQLGLRTTTREVNDEVIAVNRVVSTEPPAHSEQRKFVGVVLIVSKGPTLYTVPQTVGQDQARARTTLESRQLTLGGVTRQYHETVPVGQVISQEPAAGEQRRAATPVDLVVSLGPRPIPVPTVTGKTQDEAVAALQAAGLKPVIAPDRVNDAKVPADSVVTQAPTVGELARGAEVTIVISKGPKMIEVPSFVGKKVEQARAELQRLNLRAQVNEILGGFFGTVRAQDPVNTSVPEGSVVTLTVV